GAESSAAIGGNPVGLPRFPAEGGPATKPMPGYDVRILDGEGNEAPPGTTGSFAIKLPLPPATLRTLWKDDEGYRRWYLSRYPGYYLTGDGGYKDAEGNCFGMGRIDDGTNV